MQTTDQTPAIVNLTRRLEDTAALDGAVQALEPHIRSLFGSGPRGQLLRGEWLGHAVHPVLTDLVLGAWTSASVLDLVGGEESESSARTLVLTGLLAFGPTAWTGWAEWSEAGPREKRVGVVHAVTNGAGAGLYLASYLARRRGDRRAGAGLALAGATVSAVAGYLGSHLAAARKVGSHHPAYDATA